MTPSEQVMILKSLKTIKRIIKTIESDVLSNSEGDINKNTENLRVIGYKTSIINGIFTSYIEE